MDATHPELAAAVRFIPCVTLGPVTAGLLRGLTGLMRPSKPPADVTVERRRVGEVPLWLYRPKQVNGALLWIHGGGFVLGSPLQDQHECLRYARELNVLVAAVDYRLAPKHPFPAPLDDCYAALKWLRDEAGRELLIIAGASAGGGLAAGLSLLARDRGEVKPSFQLLVYPMLDDRTVTRTDHDVSNVQVWSPGSNRFGWKSYLGARDDVPVYAAPARETNLAGLPPTWLGVGTTDLFHDEDVAYAQRLAAAGVPCQLETIRGAYHGFDVLAPRSEVVQQFRRSQVEAVKRALAL